MRTATWTLPCRLTDSELLKHGEALAIERDERNKLVHEAKSNAADFKARIEKRDGQRIAERQRRRGAGRRCQIVWTRLLGDPGIEMHIGFARQRRRRHTGHGN